MAQRHQMPCITFVYGNPHPRQAHGIKLYPPPPLQTPGLARDGLPGGGGRRSPSDGLPGGGGGLQGYFKANCGTLHQCKQREHV